MIEITQVKLRKIFPEGKLRAIVSITLDGVFAVHDVKVIEGLDGFFVAMPNRPDGRNGYRDICHPTNAAFRKVIDDAVLRAFDAYQRQLEDEQVYEDGLTVVYSE